MHQAGTDAVQILLVENSPTQAHWVQNVLTEAGYRVVHARTAEAALECARAGAPHLIISAAILPTMNGFELCAACRREATLRHVPFILLTALDSTRDILLGLQAQADRYLIKPITAEHLLRITREVLSTPAADAAAAVAEPPCTVAVNGETYTITAPRAQVMHLLLSACDAAVHGSHELALAKQAIERHEAELESRVAERTRELADTNTALRDLVRNLENLHHAKADFVSNVSHELRTPLATMTYSLGNLLSGILGPLPENLRAYLTICAEECERLKGTVADILDLHRLDAAELILHRMKLPFQSWVARTTAKLEDKAAHKRITLALSTTPVGGFVDADPLKLDRIIASVLRNAIHFTPEGGRVELDVRTVREGAWLELAVTDDGIGVDAEHLPHLMERYYRVGEHVAGTGLGLTLCKEILERQGGEIEILSPPPGRPRGTQVRIRLPRAPAPTVLAVDDSETIQRLLAHHLKANGYTAVICDSAEAALEVLAHTTPDLLVVDDVLPGMDGVDLIARVKSNHALRHLPIIMVTGAEVDGSKREMIEEWRIPVLGKPWTGPELLACMEDAMYGKHYLER